MEPHRSRMIAQYPEIAATLDPAARVRLVEAIVTRHYRQYPREGISLLAEAIQLFPQAGQPLLSVDGGYQITMAVLRHLQARAAWYCGHYEEAISSARRGLAALESGDSFQTRFGLMRAIGGAYIMLESFSDAYDWQRQAIAVAEAEGMEAEQLLVTADLAFTYSEIGDRENARKVALELVAADRGQLDTVTLIVFINNLVYVLAHHDEPGLALSLGREGLALIDSLDHKEQFQLNKGTLNNHVAFACINLGDLAGAKKHLAVSMRCYEQLGDNAMLGIYAHYERALVALVENEPLQASKHLLAALTLCEGHNKSREFMLCHYELSRACDLIGQPDLAFHHFREYHRYYALVFSKEEQERLRTIQINFELEQVQREAELLQAQNELLERRVEERTSELEAMTQRLAQMVEREVYLSNLKTQIIENVSHEFRTPLSIVSNATDLLTMYNDQLSQEKREKYRRNINDQIKYLDALLSNTMLAAQANADEFVVRWQSYTLLELWDFLGNSWRQRFGEQGKLILNSEGQLDRPITSDNELIDRLGNRVLANAFKFAAPDAIVSVTLDATQAECWQLIFSDNGIGIPAGEEERIFALFERGSNVQTRRGLGVGLFLVNKIVAVLNGEISVSSSRKGACFQLSFPDIPNLEQV